MLTATNKEYGQWLKLTIPRLIQKYSITSDWLILWLMGPMNRSAFALVVLVDLYRTCQTMNCHVLL